jgi:hypothetical protein
MKNDIQKNTEKSKWRNFLITILALVIVTSLFFDILFLLHGGKYLAKQLIPPLPQNGVVSECFSEHTVLCENINYTTKYSAQEILSQWSTPIYQNENLDGTIVYHSKKCNESWLGLHYASFHKRQDLVCATMSAWSENNSNITHVVIQTSWSVCPYVVDEYLHQTMNWYFRCDEG